MTTLENLYYGNIAPCEFSVERGSEYESLAKLVARHDQQLTETLTVQQKELFRKYTENKIALMNLGECNAFIRGFSLAVKIMTEAMKDLLGDEIL